MFDSISYCYNNKYISKIYFSFESMDEKVTRLRKYSYFTNLIVRANEHTFN
jgi:hypothetical protein